jgi:hypothetical protein
VGRRIRVSGEQREDLELERLARALLETVRDAERRKGEAAAREAGKGEEHEND